jgi:hypothetical protein
MAKESAKSRGWAIRQSEACRDLHLYCRRDVVHRFGPVQFAREGMGRLVRDGPRVSQLEESPSYWR